MIVWNQGTGSNGRGFEARSRSTNMTFSEYARPLIRPEEICNDLRSDAQIVLAKDCRPALIGRPIYFRRPEMARRTAENPFAAIPTKEIVNA